MEAFHRNVKPVIRVLNFTSRVNGLVKQLALERSATSNFKYRIPVSNFSASVNDESL